MFVMWVGIIVIMLVLIHLVKKYYYRIPRHSIIADCHYKNITCRRLMLSKTFVTPGITKTIGRYWSHWDIIVIGVEDQPAYLLSPDRYGSLWVYSISSIPKVGDTLSIYSTHRITKTYNAPHNVRMNDVVDYMRRLLKETSYIEFGSNCHFIVSATLHRFSTSCDLPLTNDFITSFTDIVRSCLTE